LKTRILLADDHKIIRDGIRALLEKTTDMEVIAEASNGREAIELAEKKSVDVVIIDVAMPDTNGIEATRQIKTNNPNMKILALSMHSDQRFVADMLRAGASGYLLKDCAGEELERAVRTILKNQVYLSPSVAGIVADGFIHKPGQAGFRARDILTARELEILQLMAEGRTTKEIAYQLEVSIKTVETHRKNLFEKLNLSSIADLTKYAIREGLTSLDF